MLNKKRIALVLAAFIGMQALTSCFGKFALVKSVYEFNGSVAGNDMGGKFVKSLLMIGMMIIPVYQVCGFIDIIVLNLIEFWTGSNPLALAPGEIESQTVTRLGKTYQITASHNQFKIAELKKGKMIEVSTLNIDPKTQTILSERDGKQISIGTYKLQDLSSFASLKGQNIDVVF